MEPRDLSHLQRRLQQQRGLRDVLDQSALELRKTVSQLEKRLDHVEDEGSEWKTRYETQQELNRQLKKQIVLLQEKVEHIRGNPADRLSSVRSYEEMPEGALKQLIKQLEKEKKSLQNQLKDYEWKIEHEAKGYHKTIDERRTYLAEIAQISLSIETSKKQQAMGSREKQALKGKYNVPTTHRILDLKKGPIKKTTAVKQLPKLKH
uniref:Spermatogenesis-and oogenesis-specific basic helix-loop-helix-containing protein 2-like protein n=1 Tax=Callorhinchus milii TaxID=7868 RepID=V9LDR7_CALMI